jgi:hypothetical protein
VQVDPTHLRTIVPGRGGNSGVELGVANDVEISEMPACAVVIKGFIDNTVAILIVDSDMSAIPISEGDRCERRVIENFWHVPSYSKVMA